MADDAGVNVIAALGLLIADRQLRAVEQSTGLTGGAAAVLVLVGHAPGQSIDFLRRVLNRSHSAVVRMVGNLTGQGLLERGGTDDGRAVALRLTEHGRKVVSTALTERNRSVAGLLAVLTPREAGTLERLAGKLLASAVSDERSAFYICRLCDGDACNDCPVEAVFDG